jgi:hypothetical protein
MYIVLIGNITEGYAAVGPFADIEEADAYAMGPDCWLMDLESPPDGTSSVAVSDSWEVREQKIVKATDELALSLYECRDHTYSVKKALKLLREVL